MEDAHNYICQLFDALDYLHSKINLVHSDIKRKRERGRERKRGREGREREGGGRERGREGRKRGREGREREGGGRSYLLVTFLQLVIF